MPLSAPCSLATIRPVCTVKRHGIARVNRAGRSNPGPETNVSKKSCLIIALLAAACAAPAPSAPAIGLAADAAFQPADTKPGDTSTSDDSLGQGDTPAKDAPGADGTAAKDAEPADASGPDVAPTACAGAPICLALGKPGCTKKGQPCAALAAIVDGDGNPLDGATTALTIPLGSVQLGASTDLEVRLQNDAPEATAAALHIAKVTFDYTPVAKEETAGKLALTCWDGGMENPCAKAKWLDLVPKDVEPTASQASIELIRIRFQHLDAKPRTGKLRISLAGDPAWQGKEFVVPVATTSGPPKLTVPVQLVFAAGKASTLPLAIQSTGGGVLQLKSATVKGSKTFQVQITGSDVPFDIQVNYAPLTIAAGQQILAQVTSSGAAGAQATLQLTTNDPSSAVTSVQLLVK